MVFAPGPPQHPAHPPPTEVLDALASHCSIPRPGPGVAGPVCVDVPGGRPCGGQPGAVSRVRVWTYVTGALDVADRDLLTQVADALLETAGVTVDWQPCDGARVCTRGVGPAPGVTVILMSARPPDVRPDGLRA